MASIYMESEEKGKSIISDEWELSKKTLIKHSVK